MTCRRLWLCVAMFVASTLVGTESAQASGYHPGFDRAVKQADWIISHRVVSSHDPRSVLSGVKGRFVGKAFLVRVVRSFKGPFRKGDLLYIWDPSDGSTATYFIRKGRDNLTFLIKPKRRRYIAGVRVKTGTRDVAVPIRNLNGAFGRGRTLHLTGWLKLLDLTRVGSRPIPLAAMRRVIASAMSPSLVRYVLNHWTGRLTKRDARSVKHAMKRFAKDASVTATALELLRKQGFGLSVTALRNTLVKGPKYARSRMLGQVNAGNVTAVRQLLWQWIARDEQGALDAINTLARLQRRYLVGQLRRQRLPFWLEIPALKAVGGVVRRGYSRQALKLNRWQLVDAGRLVKGKTFGAAYSLQTRKPVWRQLVKLVMPSLPTMKREPRELTLAIARTWGFEVFRKGKRARLGRRRPLPLTATVRAVPGARHKVMVIVRASTPTLVCATSQRRISISQGRSSVTSMDSTLGAFHNTKTARTCFKRRSGVVSTTVVDLASLVKNVKKPGTYELSVDVLLPYSGSEHGLNAWTGMLHSNRLRLQLP